MHPFFSLFRVFQLESQRRQNEMQALAPGSMHPRVHVTTVIMTIGAIMSLVGFLFYLPLLPVGIIVFAVAFAVVVAQAIVDAARSN